MPGSGICVRCVVEGMKPERVFLPIVSFSFEEVVARGRYGDFWSAIPQPGGFESLLHYKAWRMQQVWQGEHGMCPEAQRLYYQMRKEGRSPLTGD